MRSAETTERRKISVSARARAKSKSKQTELILRVLVAVMPVTEQQFEAASAVIADKTVKPVAPFTFSDQCRFYGLYKRGTVGRLLPPYEADDIDTDKRPASRPGLLSVTARAKYDAWAAAQDMTKQEARDEYVALGQKLVGPPIDEAVQKAS